MDKEERLILLSGEIDQNNANEIIMNLLYLDSLNHDNIYLYINCYGGSVQDGLAIIDTMNYIKSNVITVAVGVAYSMAAVILSNGDIRTMLPNSEAMIHEVSSQYNGKAKDIINSTNRVKIQNNKIINILSKNTNLNKKEIENLMQNDYFMDSKKCLEIGLVDTVIER